VITAADELNMLKAGFIVVASNIIQSREPNKPLEHCQSDAFVQMQDVLARLREGDE
jgi:hypothetical protein